MSNPLEYLGLADLQAIAQVRGIKDYKSMSRDIKYYFSIKKRKKKAKKAKKIKN